MRYLVIFTFLAAAAAANGAQEALYPLTPAGSVELKTVPPVVAVAAEGEGSSFENLNIPFRKLFRYIREHKYAMTIPVEADTDANRMRFLPSRSILRPALKTGADVKIIDLPERRVVSAGLRGSYSRKLYEEGLARARAWLAQHSEWREAGPPYKVFWDPPWKLGFLKRSEVHIPVTASAAKP